MKNGENVNIRCTYRRGILYSGLSYQTRLLTKILYKPCKEGFANLRKLSFYTRKYSEDQLKVSTNWIYRGTRREGEILHQYCFTLTSFPFYQNIKQLHFCPPLRQAYNVQSYNTNKDKVEKHQGNRVVDINRLKFTYIIYYVLKTFFCSCN